VTVRDVISAAFRKLGVLASGEQPNAAELSDALDCLNLLLDSWNIEKLMCFAILPQTFPFQAGKLSYTMGPGGDWKAQWPTRVENVKLLYDTGGTPMVLDIEIINRDQYLSFIVPSTSSTIPMWVYIDDGFPLKTFYFYTVPSIVNSVNIFTWSQVTEFSDANVDVELPPGYARAILYNLALELAPEYGKEPSAVVAAAAATSKANIKSFNMRPLYMQVDQALTAQRAGFNWLTGE
jgi:hypothetical protein